MTGNAEASSDNGFDKNLENLFKNRFHGAANIRGIRYQILYTVFRSLDLFDKDSSIHTIRAEGIEDVDLQGLSTGSEFIQVKYSQKPWNWAKLKEPIENFFQAYTENSDNNFILVVNFELQKDFGKLANLNTLSLKERQRIEKKFRQLCINGGFPRKNFPDFLSRFKIISLPEMKIIKELRRKIANSFELIGETVDIYISVFMANFLKWADKRIAITISELKELHFRIQEILSEEEFNAYGRGLIKRISWEVDKNTGDFFDGKKTRPGHIVSGLDVKRPKWLERIDSAVRAAKICVIRSSSGQGKSTLMFRFAYEKWSGDNTYILKTVETPEHVEQIRNYLKIRSELGIPILLLIDDTGWQLRLWSYVLNDCAALGINAILTIRNEDWFRFSIKSLTGYEVIEPTLDLEEAIDIYNRFNSQHKVHPSVTSAEWAYEKIGEPRLLMEYAYLLTHGRMLEERLRDQIKEILKLKEEPAKIEILRKIAISDSLGAPIILEKLIKKVEMKSDPQNTLGSLIGEYLTIEGGNILGLHWVRSNHLLMILHENFLNPAHTVLETIDMIPEEMVSAFVSNAIARKELDREIFINGLLEKSSNESLRHILSYIEGIFEAGERIYFEVNRELFDEGFDFLGKAGISLLCSEFLPIINPNTLDRMLEIVEGEQAINFKKLKAIKKKVKEHPRGLDLSRNFIEKLVLRIDTSTLKEEPGQTGKLLDWCFLCKSPLPFWAKIRDTLFSEKNILDLPFEEFCQFAIGLYRQSEKDYWKWYQSERDMLLGYLKLYTACLELSVTEEKLYIEFLPESENETSLNDQAVNRLTKLRTAIPFCQRYQSKALWFLPDGLTPSVDNSQKNMPRENLHIESDISKNVVWRKIVENFYLPDSYYNFQMSWYNLRKDALLYFSDFSQGLKGLLEGKKNTFRQSVNDGKLSAKIISQLTLKPDPPQQTPKHLCDFHREGPARWASHLENFFAFLFRYFNGSNNEETKRFIVHNFNESLKHLSVVHESFKEFFKISPDYFDAASLDNEEKKKYGLFADLLDIWLVNPISQFQKNIVGYIKSMKDRKRNLMIQNVKETLSPLENTGVQVILPFDNYYDYPLRYFPLAYSVPKPTEGFEELYQLLNGLKSVKEVAQFFWVIPVYKGYRFGKEGYCFSSDRLDELCEGSTDNWESLVPREVPNEILSLLPPIPLRVDRKLKVRNEIHGLVGAIPMLNAIKTNAQRLVDSENTFEKELYNRYKSKVINAIEELATTSANVEAKFEREFPQKSKTSEYRKIIQFFQNIKHSKEQDNLDEFLDKIQSKREEIRESVDQLLNETYEP